MPPSFDGYSLQFTLDSRVPRWRTGNECPLSFSMKIFLKLFLSSPKSSFVYFWVYHTNHGPAARARSGFVGGQNSALSWIGDPPPENWALNYWWKCQAYFQPPFIILTQDYWLQCWILQFAVRSSQQLWLIHGWDVPLIRLFIHCWMRYFWSCKFLYWQWHS